MLKLRSPIFSRAEDSAAGSGGFNVDLRLQLIRECDLSDENIEKLLLPSLLSSNKKVNGEALTKLHGRGDGGGISKEQSKKFGEVLKNYKLQNPDLHDDGMLAFTIVRAQNSKAAELLCEILKYQTKADINQDASMTISALSYLGYKAACAIEPLKSYLLDENIGYLAERAIIDINKSIINQNAQNHSKTNYKYLPLTETAALKPTGNREQIGKWLDSQLRFTLSNLDLHSCCRIRIFNCGRDQTIVLFTADNQSYGTAPTLAIEELATYAARAFNLDPGKTTFVEHYDPSYGDSLDEEVSIISRLVVKEHNNINILANPDWIIIKHPNEAWKLLEGLGLKQEWL